MSSSVIFIFNGINTTIQCKKEDKMKDICYNFISKIQIDINQLYFIYSGNNINFELTFNQQANLNDKERNQMNILVFEKSNTIMGEGTIKSKEIICPQCQENCLIRFENYEVKLYDCRNNHEINNILLEEYNNSQIINELDIICNNCNQNNKYKSYNNQFYKCLTCKKNLCPICKSTHYKEHKIIDYENKNYICEEHKDFFISYCNECKKNLCIISKSKHNNHEIINYENILSNEEEIKEEIKIF